MAHFSGFFQRCKESRRGPDADAFNFFPKIGTEVPNITSQEDVGVDLDCANDYGEILFRDIEQSGKMTIIPGFKEDAKILHQTIKGVFLKRLREITSGFLNSIAGCNQCDLR